MSQSPKTAEPPNRPTADTDLWKRLLTELWKKPAVASHMERARLKSAGDAEWVVGFGDAFAMASVQRNQGFLEETISAVAGRPTKVRLVQDVQDRREPEAASVVVPSVADEGRRVVAPDAGVQKVLDVFKGRVRPEGRD